MRCVELRRRLHQLFDERRHPDTDPRIVSHTQRCGRCRDLLRAYEALYDGLDSMPLPQSDHFTAARVLAEVELLHRRRRRRVRRGIGLLATAVGLLIAVGLSYTWTDGEGGKSVDFLANTWANRSVRQHAADRTGADSLPYDGTADAERRYLAMVKMTVDAMAALPDAVLGTAPEGQRVAAHVGSARWMAPMANSIRPLTDSVSAALGVLRRTLPGKSHDQEPSETT